MSDATIRNLIASGQIKGTITGLEALRDAIPAPGARRVFGREIDALRRALAILDGADPFDPATPGVRVVPAAGGA